MTKVTVPLLTKEANPLVYKIVLFEFFRSACKYLLKELDKLPDTVMTRTWQMKMFYFTIINKASLFDYFDYRQFKFEAWRNGAVEIDCYKYLCDGLSSDDIGDFNEFVKNITSTEEAKIIYHSLNDMFSNENLKEHITDADALVYINHDLPLWIRTPFESRMNVNPQTAEYEKEYFDNNYLNKPFFLRRKENGKLEKIIS